MIWGGGLRPLVRKTDPHTEPFTGACGVPWVVRWVSPGGSPGEPCGGLPWGSLGVPWGVSVIQPAPKSEFFVDFRGEREQKKMNLKVWLLIIVQ